MKITVVAATKKNIYIASDNRRLFYGVDNNVVELHKLDSNISCMVDRHLETDANVLGDLIAFNAKRTAAIYVYNDNGESAIGVCIYDADGLHFAGYALNGQTAQSVAINDSGTFAVVAFKENVGGNRMLLIELSGEDTEFAEQNVGPYYEQVTFNGDNYILGVQTKPTSTNPQALDVYSFNSGHVGSLLDVLQKAIVQKFGATLAPTVQMTPHICAASDASLFFVRTTHGVFCLSLEQIDGRPAVGVSHILPMAITDDVECVSITCSNEGHYVGQINRYPAIGEGKPNYEVFVRARNNKLCWTNTIECDGVDMVIDTTDGDMNAIMVTEMR